MIRKLLRALAFAALLPIASPQLALAFNPGVPSSSSALQNRTPGTFEYDKQDQLIRDIIATFASGGGVAISVTSAGAKCDGATDDTTAFQAAEATAQHAGLGASVFVPPGVTCLLSGQLSVASTWFSLGNCPTLKWTTDLGAGVSAFVTENNSRIAIDDLCFVGPGGDNYPGPGVKAAQMDGVQFGISASAAPQPHLRDIRVAGFNSGLVIDTSYGHWLIDGHSVFTNNYRGIELRWTGGDAKIIGAEITGNGLAGISCTNTTGYNSPCLNGGCYIAATHIGFSPYGILVEPGNPINPGGIASSCTFDEVHFESIGNAAFKVESHSYGVITAQKWNHMGFMWDAPGLNGSNWTYELGGAATPPTITATCTPTNGTNALTCSTNPVTAGIAFTQKITGTGIPNPAYVVSSAASVTYSSQPSETFNPSDKDAGETLSNANLTATAAGCAAGNNWCGVRASPAVPSTMAGALEYSEHVITANAGTAGASGDWSLGIGNANFVLAPAGGQYLGKDNNGIGYFPWTGAVYTNNASAATIQTCAQGHTVGEAVDYSRFLIYWRCDAGNWNNSASANPALGIGGISFLNIGGPYYDIFDGADSAAVTSNFGGSAFTNTVPSASNVVTISENATSSPGAETVSAFYERIPVDLGSGDLEGILDITSGDYPFMPGIGGAIINMAHCGANGNSAKVHLTYDGPYLQYNSAVDGSQAYRNVIPQSTSAPALMTIGSDNGFCMQNSRIDTAYQTDDGGVANIVIPGANVDVTAGTVNASTVAAVWSSTAHNSGLQYFEVYVNSIGNNQKDGVICIAPSTATTTSECDALANYEGFDLVGDDFTNGSYTGTRNNAYTGALVQVAVDLTHDKWWYRTWYGGSASYWDNVPGDNPATNTGGFGGIAAATSYVVGFQIDTNLNGGPTSGQSVSFNFAGPWNPIAGGPPAGFSAWGGVLGSPAAQLTVNPGSASGTFTALLDLYAFSPYAIVPICSPVGDPGARWWLGATTSPASNQLQISAYTQSIPVNDVTLQCSLRRP